MTLSQHIQALAEKLRYRWDLAFHRQSCPFGPDYQRFWDRRYMLFSRFDRGIRTDGEGLHTVTPEKAAKEIARNIKTAKIVDAFCGIGGNAIAFAGVCKQVYAFDIDNSRLGLAAHNAKVYEYRNIDFIHRDFRDLGSVEAETVFLDPPWGGANYRNKSPFTLNDFSPPGRELLDFAFGHFKYVILKVPFNFDLAELDQFGRPYKAQDHLLEGRIICRTLYFHA